MRYFNAIMALVALLLFLWQMEDGVCLNAAIDLLLSMHFGAQAAFLRFFDSEGDR